MKSPLPLILAVIAIVLIAIFALQTNPATDENIDTMDGAAVEITDESAEVVSTFTLPETVSYTTNLEESLFTWEAGHVVGPPYNGTVDIASGELILEDGLISEGTFVIDMTTIEHSDDNQNLEEHMRNEDFFDVENYPVSTIVLTDLTMQEDGTYTATGELTILETTNEITFPVTFTEVDDHVIANAAFEIDRTEWNITYGSDNFFDNLGDRAIKNMIGFTLDMTLETDSE